eukprot:IDg11484t1
MADFRIKGPNGAVLGPAAIVNGRAAARAQELGDQHRAQPTIQIAGDGVGRLPRTHVDVYVSWRAREQRYTKVQVRCTLRVAARGLQCAAPRRAAPRRAHCARPCRSAAASGAQHWVHGRVFVRIPHNVPKCVCGQRAGIANSTTFGCTQTHRAGCTASNKSKRWEHTTRQRRLCAPPPCIDVRTAQHYASGAFGRADQGGSAGGRRTEAKFPVSYRRYRTACCTAVSATPFRCFLLYPARLDHPVRHSRVPLLFAP